MILANSPEEAKREGLSLKVSLTLKREFTSEAAATQIDNNEYSKMLTESRHAILKLITFSVLYYHEGNNLEQKSPD